MTNGFKRVEKECQEFCDKVERCRAEDRDMADIKDTYSRLLRAHDRYEYEAQARSLDPSEYSAFRKVFEQDELIESVLKVRLIADHVEKGGAELLSKEGDRFKITAESSAAAVFGAPVVYLDDVDGVPHCWDHLKELGEAERRISRAIAKAKDSGGGRSGRRRRQAAC
jgi:hypothetical protein